MAEAWGMPPWAIEEHANVEWPERFVAYRKALAARQQREMDRYQPVSSAGNVTVTDLL